MIPAKFDYLRPATVEEAVAALRGSHDAKLLGGGQSLLPVLRLRLAAPELVVDLGGIAELRGVREEGSGDDAMIVVGAMTTHHDVLRDELVREHVGLLADAAATVADPQVRHRGTLGGSLAHADPAGDLGAVALALGASFDIIGESGRRTVPAEEFFVDLFTTAIGDDEVLARVRFPRYTGWRTHYEKFNRTAQAWSMVAVAVALEVEDTAGGPGTISEARVGLTNMGTTPIRAVGVEQALVGRPATEETVRAAAAHATEGTSAPSDADAAADYREHLATVLTGRAVLTAAG